MQIRWLGHASFMLKFRGLTVVTDPYDDYVGYAMPEVEADVVTVSHHHKDHDNVSTVGGSPKTVDFGGIVAGGVEISSFETFHDDAEGQKRGKSLVFKFKGDGITVCHLGDVGAVFGDVAEFIKGADVLLVPVGGNYTVDGFDAMSYVLSARPAFVIPMHYKTADCLFDIDNIDSFVELFDTDHVHFLQSDSIEVTEKLLSAFPDTQIIVLKK